MDIGPVFYDVVGAGNELFRAQVHLDAFQETVERERSCGSANQIHAIECEGCFRSSARPNSEVGARNRHVRSLVAVGGIADIARGPFRAKSIPPNSPYSLLRLRRQIGPVRGKVWRRDRSHW